MTAPLNDKPAESALSEIPSAFDILVYSATLTRRLASDTYGFTAYLLFPLILSFGIQGIPGSIGMFANVVVNTLFVLTLCWVISSIITTVSLRAGHPKKEHDPRSIGIHSWNVLGSFIGASVLFGILLFAGSILFIIPGIIVAVLFTFTAQEIVLRGQGPLSALASSKRKVQHQFLTIAWRLFAIIAIAVLLYTALGTAVLSTGAWASGTPLATLLISKTPLWLDAALTLLQIAIIPPVVIAHTVLYIATDPEPERQKETLPEEKSPEAPV